MFQFSPPRGRCLSIASIALNRGLFQFSPPRGRCLFTAASVLSPKSFNSHLRVGGVVPPVRRDQRPRVSILTSAWEVSGRNFRGR